MNKRVTVRVSKNRDNTTPKTMIWSSKFALHDGSADGGPGFQAAKPPFWRETWFYEQVFYVLVCLTPAMLASWQMLAAKGPVTMRDTVLLVGTMLGQFLAQKARSVATRQSALLKCRGIYVPEVRCAPEMRKWIAAGQVLGAFMSVATAPTWWHLPSILWAVFAYDLWRNHREARKLRKPEFVIGGF